MKTETARHEAQLREFLGDASYQIFRDYEKTVPERTLVSQFASKYSGTSLVPSAVQQEELHQQMSAGRVRFNWITPLSRRDQSFAEYVLGLNQEAINTIINTFAEEEGEFGRQFLAEASRILNPEQVTAFGRFLERQRQSQLNQMKISAKFFSSENQ
jgi:hypothetical protein